MATISLKRVYPWLKPDGALVFVIARQRLRTCDQVLAEHFRDQRVYRLSAPDAAEYSQVVAFGVPRTRYEQDRQCDTEVIRARKLLEEMSPNWKELRPVSRGRPHAADGKSIARIRNPLASPRGSCFLRPHS